MTEQGKFHRRRPQRERRHRGLSEILKRHGCSNAFFTKRRNTQRQKDYEIAMYKGRRSGDLSYGQWVAAQEAWGCL